MDTIRRRHQVFGSKRKVSEKELKRLGGRFRRHSSGVFQAFQWILRNEGIRGFWKGFSLALIKNPLGIAISFTVNDDVKYYLGWQGWEAAKKKHNWESTASESIEFRKFFEFASRSKKK